MVLHIFVENKRGPTGMIDLKAASKSKVVWVDANPMTFDNNVSHKLIKLLSLSEATQSLNEGMEAVLKVNTSEDGYVYGLRPMFVRVVAEEIGRVTKNHPAICDGIKLVDYWRKAKGNFFLKTAYAGGYSNDTLGGNFVINGGFSGDEGNLYQIDCENNILGGVKVGTAICRSDKLWVLSHVTVHPLFGLNGALLNGGFECLVCSERTRVLRGLDPYPFNGLSDSVEDLEMFCRRSLESHLGVAKSLNGSIFYVNYLWDVTVQPDYFPFSDSPFVENIGFLASNDPVALDAATYSLLQERLSVSGIEKRNFIYERTNVEFTNVLAQAEALGLGSLKYELTHVF
ncbi:MAG: DUF362 domain-containing protein [Desulfomonilaceae bacterium]